MDAETSNSGSVGGVGDGCNDRVPAGGASASTRAGASDGTPAADTADGRNREDDMDADNNNNNGGGDGNDPGGRRNDGDVNANGQEQDDEDDDDDEEEEDGGDAEDNHHHRLAVEEEGIASDLVNDGVDRPAQRRNATIVVIDSDGNMDAALDACLKVAAHNDDMIAETAKCLAESISDGISSFAKNASAASQANIKNTQGAIKSIYKAHWKFGGAAAIDDLAVVVGETGTTDNDAEEGNDVQSTSSSTTEFLSCSSVTVSDTEAAAAAQAAATQAHTQAASVSRAVRGLDPNLKVTVDTIVEFHKDAMGTYKHAMDSFKHCMDSFQVISKHAMSSLKVSTDCVKEIGEAYLDRN